MIYFYIDCVRLHLKKVRLYAVLCSVNMHINTSEIMLKKYLAVPAFVFNRCKIFVFLIRGGLQGKVLQQEPIFIIDSFPDHFFIFSLPTHVERIRM